MLIITTASSSGSPLDSSLPAAIVSGKSISDHFLNLLFVLRLRFSAPLHRRRERSFLNGLPDWVTEEDTSSTLLFDELSQPAKNWLTRATWCPWGPLLVQQEEQFNIHSHFLHYHKLIFKDDYIIIIITMCCSLSFWTGRQPTAPSYPSRKRAAAAEKKNPAVKNQGIILVTIFDYGRLI